MEKKLFTSESVSEGHPDKVADQISDAILDAILIQDPNPRVACETLVKGNDVIIAGEITTTAIINFDKIIRETIADIGYTSDELGFNAYTCNITSIITKQSPDIACGVDRAEDYELEHGAGDQGMAFGYACNETNELMPLPIFYAHKLMQKQAVLRKNGKLSFLRPDAKAQITVEYVNNTPQYIKTILLSTQHSQDIDQKTLQEAVIEEIILPTIPKDLLSKDVKLLINPTGQFIIGGPVADCGLTGRKIIVDTYGGMARHGGGAFSGKDPTKVDRSAAYMARYIAKNIVASKIAEKCEIQLSYAIGMAKPISVYVNCFNTNIISELEILDIITQNFKLHPDGMIETLNLKNPIYKKTACYGHFGREDCNFTWENVDKELKN